MNKVRTRISKTRKKSEIPRLPELQSRLQEEQALMETVAPQVAYCRASVNGSGLRRADLLALQRAVGNRQVQRMVTGRGHSSDKEPKAADTSLIDLSHTSGAIARSPDETGPTLPTKMPAMTPEDMYNKLIAVRGFEEHIPVHQLKATEHKLRALEAELKSNPSPKLGKEYRKLLNRYNLSRLASSGAAAGKGFNTFAIIQVVDKDGNIVATATGKYPGKQHAEEIAVAQLRQELKGSKVPAGRLEVVGDKKVCAEQCRPALIDFAKDYDLVKVEGHIFRREKLVGTGPASEKTTARTVTLKSSLDKPLTKSSEVIYSFAKANLEPGARPSGLVGGKTPSTLVEPPSQGTTTAVKSPTTKVSGQPQKVARPGSATKMGGKVPVKAAIANIRLATPLLGLLGGLLAGWYLEKVKRKEQVASIQRQMQAMEQKIEEHLKGPVLQNGINALRTHDPNCKLYVALTITVETMKSPLGEFGPFFNLRTMGVTATNSPSRVQHFQPVVFLLTSKTRTDISFTIPLEGEGAPQ